MWCTCGTDSETEETDEAEARHEDEAEARREAAVTSWRRCGGHTLEDLWQA